MFGNPQSYGQPQIDYNKKKEKDTHPDFTGSLNVEGVEYWVSAWKRKPDASPNAPSLSFSIKPKDQQPQQYSQPQQADQFSDDVPF